jgi:type I restriction enzyme S subunit
LGGVMAGGAALAEKADILAEMDGPWPLPEGWAWAKIESVLAPMEGARIIHHGWSPQCEVSPSGSVDVWGVLKTTAVQPGTFLAHENKALPSHLVPRANLEVRAGDLLLTCAGPRARCGVACLVRETRPRLIFSGKMYRFRPAPEVMDSGFLEAFLQTSHAWRAIDQMKTGGSDSGLNLTHDRFRQLLVPVAPLDEQRRIMRRMDLLFGEVVEGEEALTSLRNGLDIFRRAVVKAAVAGELTKDWRATNPVSEDGTDLVAGIAKTRSAKRTPQIISKSPAFAKQPDPSTLPELPNGWAWATLDQMKIGDQRNGISIAGSLSPPGVKAMRLDALTTSGLDLNAVRYIPLQECRISTYRVNAGDLLVSRANGSPEFVGRAVYVEEIGEIVVFPDTIIRYPLGPERQVGRWLELAWNSPLARSQIRKLAKQRRAS